MKRVKYLMVLLVLLALPMISTAPVSAAALIEVSPPVLVTSIAAGESRTHTMLVRSAAGSPPMDVVIEVKGLGQSLAGEFQPVASPEDKSPYSARGFIRISPPKFHLEPGALQEIEVVIAVPRGAGDGARYAIIHTRGKPVGGGGIEIAVGMSVEVTIADTERIKAGSISDFTIGEIAPGKPLEITAILKNSGNFRYKAWAEAILKDGDGNRLATASTPLTTVSIIPGNSHRFNLLLTTPREELPAGAFIDLVIKLGDGTVLASQSKRLGGVDSRVVIGGAVVVGLMAAGIGAYLVMRKKKTREVVELGLPSLDY